jgi:hypothetical protein
MINKIIITSFDNYDIEINFNIIKKINYLYLLIEDKIYIDEKIKIQYKYCTLFNLNLILKYFNDIENYNIDNLNIDNKKKIFLCANYLDIPDYLDNICNDIINIYI